MNTQAECTTCRRISDIYVTCFRNQKDYCRVHEDHAFHNCLRETLVTSGAGIVEEAPSKHTHYGVCFMCDAIVTNYVFCRNCSRDYCQLHKDHVNHVKEDPNAETSLSVDAIVQFFGGPLW